jgi:hypothetical protein
MDFIVWIIAIIVAIIGAVVLGYVIGVALRTLREKIRSQRRRKELYNSYYDCQRGLVGEVPVEPKPAVKLDTSAE